MRESGRAFLAGILSFLVGLALVLAVCGGSSQQAPASPPLTTTTSTPSPVAGRPTLAPAISTDVVEIPWADGRDSARVWRADLGVPLRFHTLHLWKGKLYAIGGEKVEPDISTRYRDEVYVIDPAPLLKGQGAPTVALFTRLARAVGHHDSFLLGDRCVVVGGMSAKGKEFASCSAIQVVDLGSGKVEIADRFSPGRHDPEVVFFPPERMVIVGGWDDLFGSTDVSLFGIDPASGAVQLVRRWTLIKPRTYSTAHRLPDGRLAIVGGLNHSPKDTHNAMEVELITLDSPSPPQVLKQRFPEPGPRYQSSRLVDGKIYVLGGTLNEGMGRGEAHAQVYVVDPVKETISPTGSLQIPRYHFQSVTLRRNDRAYILILGGQSDDGKPVLTPELYDVAARRSVPIPGLQVCSVDHDRIVAWSGSTLFLVGGENVTFGYEDPRLVNQALIAIDLGKGVEIEQR